MENLNNAVRQSPDSMNEQPVPLIIPRQNHSISRRSIDPDTLKVLYRLQNHGFLAYLVGGCVRDLLLGKTPKDFDVVTDAHPQQIREVFRNSRLIGRRFRLAHVCFKRGKFIEVSTFRRRSEYEEGEEGDLPRPRTPSAHRQRMRPAEILRLMVSFTILPTFPW